MGLSFGLSMRSPNGFIEFLLDYNTHLLSLRQRRIKVGQIIYIIPFFLSLEEGEELVV